MSLFQKALDIANKAHQEQKRKYMDEKGIAMPYIIHPISVASLVRTYLQKESLETGIPINNIRMDKLMCAAVMHDVLEDTDYTVDEMKLQFGIEITNLVVELTSDKNKIAEIGKTNYLKDKLLNMSDDALFIKLCDRLDNINDSFYNKEMSEKLINDTREILSYICSNRDNKLTWLHTAVLCDIQNSSESNR